MAIKVLVHRHYESICHEAQISLNRCKYNQWYWNNIEKNIHPLIFKSKLLRQRTDEPENSAATRASTAFPVHKSLSQAYIGARISGGPSTRSGTARRAARGRPPGSRAPKAAPKAAPLSPAARAVENRQHGADGGAGSGRRARAARSHTGFEKRASNNKPTRVLPPPSAQAQDPAGEGG